MNRLLVLCAVFIAGLAIGGAASWLMLDQGEGAPGRPLPSSMVLQEAVRPEPSPPLDVEPESRATASPIRPTSFKEASRGALEDGGAVPVGTGKISGRVRTDKGEALAGVVVRAQYQGDREDRAAPAWKTGDGVPPDEDMQARVRRFIDDAERERAMRREATTAANGEFTIDGLLDDRYRLSAYFKGYAITMDQRNLQWSARPGLWAEFTASPVIAVPVEVRLADGTVPKRAQLEVKVGNSSTGEAWRPDRPEIRLGAGSYTIRAAAGDHEEWRSEAQNVTLKEGSAPTPLSFRLMARTGIHGRVKTPKGYALESLSIFALRYSGTAVPDERALRAGQNSWASPWNGFEFDFQDLAPGTWLIGAGTWESVFTTKTVEVAAGTIAEAVLEITDADASGLVVRVIGPDRTPVADASVRVSPPPGQHDSQDTFTVRPKKDGAWVVVPKKDAPADPKDWLVSVHSERYGDKSVPMPASMSSELRVELAEPSSLEVTVLGYAGSGLEGRLKVDVRPLQGKDQSQRIYYSRDDALGPEGRQTVKPLQPGRYRVELQYQRERWSGTALDRVDVDVGPGANAVSIPVPVVHTLNVVVSGEPGDASLSMHQVGLGGSEERWHNARVGPDGTATFEGLVAGTYRLSLWSQKGRRGKSMKVTVPCAGTVTFKEEAETALVVKVLDSEGYLASAGLQAGDVITGVDGSAFDGSRPAMQVLGGLMAARKDLKLLVLRGGKTSEVAVDSEKFAAATNHTRSLEPAAR